MTRIGMLLFPNLTLLDLIGPQQVFASFPQAQIELVAASRDLVRADSAVQILPTATYADAGTFDVVFVPGGYGVNEAMQDAATIAFLSAQGQRARWVTSVCTGALVLGAAGLLRGYRATTHWRYLELLPSFGAHAADERVVLDRNRVTGGGVTAGIDFALVLAQELFGLDQTRRVQLYLQYDPQPPLSGGSPQTAPAEIVEAVLAQRAEAFERRRAIVQRLTEAAPPRA
ncbi:MAG TPA: DJ-1/PfpI family protein [Candidatus Acidoferrales bacterium]|nr:DJ-1/PfpI family protein [Candidatus Acidoferrales bacterium]